MSDNEELEDQLPPQQEANEDGEAEAQGEGEPGEGAAGLVEGEADEEDEAEYQDSSEVSAWSRCSRRHGEADPPKRRKKKKRERELRLDDDDYDLLEENQVQVPIGEEDFDDLDDQDEMADFIELLGPDGGSAPGGGMDLDAAAEWVYTCMRDANTPEWRLLARGAEEGAGGSQGGTQGAAGAGGGGGATRRPNRGAANRTARLIGMQELVSDFCLEPSAFLANLQEAGHAGVGANEPRTPPGAILDWAAGALESLKARHPENPIISSYSPESLVSAAVVSAEATEAGEAVLDPFHKYALATRLRKKRLADFGSSDLFLRLDEAARERLASLRLHLESAAAEKLVNDVAELFQSSDRGAVAQQWNGLRRDVVKAALEEQLLPAFRAHFHAKLLAEAREHALRLEDEFLASPRLCIVCYGNQELNPATGQPNNTAVVFLNELGNLTDFFFAGQLSGQIRRSGQGAGAVFTDPAKSKDAARIREKLLEHLPHAVLVGIAAPACRQLHEDMRNIVDSLLEHHADALIDHETRGITVFPMDEKLAALWEVSAAGRSELREHAPLVRRAVGLGRSALDPLSLLAALCGPDKEVLSLGVYDMQDALGKDDRMAAVTRVMVTAGAQVGVDVNLACNVAWRSELLQFVPGLGPRKAGALLAALQRNRNKAESRSMLYKDLGVLGKVVFRNCGAYLRIESFDLEKFMSDAAAEGKPLPVGLPTLIDIVAELVCPAMELRPAWQEISPRQVKITYVTRDCLKVILINSGTEGMVPAEEVSGSYTGRVGGPEWQAVMQSRLNSVARGRIIRIEEQPDQSGSGTRFMVVLSTKSSVVNDEGGEYERKYCASREPNYVVREKTEATAKRRADEAGRSREQTVLVRPIRHPMFKNISQLDAVHALAPKEVPVGSAILRPSYRRNPNELDVTIKIAQLAAGPVFAVTFLRESDKPQGRAAHLTLAPPFTIDASHCGLGNLVYEDLDQMRTGVQMQPQQPGGYTGGSQGGGYGGQPYPGGGGGYGPPGGGYPPTQVGNARHGVGWGGGT
eukprot:XP_001697661.1 glycine rich protein [Chlamydomonas reinhardtii]